MIDNSAASASLEEKIRLLSPELQQEVEHFVTLLLEKQRARPRAKPTFGWAGALKDLRDQYTSVELQHQIADWRTGGY